MREAISIYGGGFGVSLGKACLEQYAEEHNIAGDGFFKDEQRARDCQVNNKIRHNVHFRENSYGQWTPRSLFFDMETDHIDSLLQSEIGQMIQPGQWSYESMQKEICAGR